MRKEAGKNGKMQQESPTGRARLRAPKASQMVAAQLRRAIVRGELAEGRVLSERELLGIYGVSRPTLREAVRLLEAENLIELTYGPGGGARIMRPSLDVAARYFCLLLQADGVRLADVYGANSLIEPAAIRMIARDRPQEAAAALRRCLEDMSLDRDRIENNAIAFSRFHRVIVEQTHNETLIRLTKLMANIFERYLGAVGAIFGEKIDIGAAVSDQLKLRRRIVDLIEQGDGEQAAALWERFLDDSSRILQEWQPAELVVDLLDG